MIFEKEHYKKIDHPKYKYELIKDCYFFDLSIDKYSCTHKYFTIQYGCITAKKIYRWDGCSGPTKDDNSNMRGSLFHDIWYQDIREGLIPRNWRPRRAGDKLFLRILKEDGMSWFRRTAYFYSVRGAGAFFAYF